MSTMKSAFIQDAQTDDIMEVGDLFSGAAKAWFNYNHVTVAIRDSFNISSITDVSTGIINPIFTNALANDGYAAPGGSGEVFTTGIAITSTNLTEATNFHGYITTANGTVIDRDYVTYTATGDLA